MRFYLLMILLFIFCLIGKSQTVQSVYDYAKSIGIKQAVIVTSQAALETGWFKSYGCKTRKNLFGLGGSNQMSFDTWQESVVFYRDYIQNRYKGGSYFEFLDRIGYAADKSYNEKVRSISSKLVIKLEL